MSFVSNRRRVVLKKALNQPDRRRTREYIATWVRLSRPNLSRMVLTCDFTVFSEIFSFQAISLFAGPAVTIAILHPDRRLRGPSWRPFASGSREWDYTGWLASHPVCTGIERSRKLRVQSLQLLDT
jgi:hypothetical protein